MKLLSNAEYLALVRKSEQASGPQKDSSGEIKLLNTAIDTLKTEITNTKLDTDIILKRKDNEVDNKIYEATKELKTELAKITAENESNKKEVSILTKAFANLGFDVKDMKEILNKLVDGIVSKNTVQVIGGGK